MSFCSRRSFVAQRVPVGRIVAYGDAARLAGPAALEIGLAQWRPRRTSTPAGTPA
ncbi:hypothetical protein [Ralstonia solanacearum]|uniref:hypothetical protein n=1 Tax=Ralstonia solanacearum TaxID=305 RepID=UPI000A63D675|nr:hypothetical protein [Ralstonia solanacearum]QJC26484.1 hypothetical protein G8D25_21410 [Ralstonia solanacearum]